MLTRTFVAVVVAAVVSLTASGAWALTYTFNPPAPFHPDMQDLDHLYNYKWGINFTVPAGQQITGAELFFDNIANWDNNPNTLWADLLPSAAVGVSTSYDNENPTDAFAGQGTPLFKWQGLTTTPSDRTHVFTDAQLLALTTYAADGNFGIGLDPDCHYFNDRVQLRIFTSPLTPPSPALPEPVTAGLAGVGLGALALAASRRRRA